MKALFALSFLMLTLIGCAAFEPQSRAPFVGEWLYADKEQSCRYSFHADGSFSGEVSRHGELISQFKGKWKVEPGALLYTYTGDVFKRIPPGTTDRDQVIQMRRDSFLIQAANGERRRYRRVR